MYSENQLRLLLSLYLPDMILKRGTPSVPQDKFRKLTPETYRLRLSDFLAAFGYSFYL